MNDRSGNSWLWYASALLIVVLAALGLRYGTNVLDRPSAFDERHIRVPIDNLVGEGWSVETAIDFAETKGPTMIWVYAVWRELCSWIHENYPEDEQRQPGALEQVVYGARVLGSELNDYRLLSVLLFAGGVVPLLLLCRRCGMDGPALPAVAALYVLLPHHAVLGQLLMSEPLFVFGALWLMWAFVWGFGTSRVSQRAVLGPIVFGVILSVLLHLRIHAVAFAGAAALVAVERDWKRSWPWLLACAAAGLSRLPLWFRWGGAVAPEYQSMHDVGLNLDAATYMAAAWIPFAAILLVRGFAGAKQRRWILAAAAAGLVLAVIGSPSLTETVAFGDLELRRFQGFVATSVRTLTSSVVLQAIVVGAMAVAGSASMGALAATGWDRPVTDPGGVVIRLAVWTLVGGCGLYTLTHAYVFDRYVLGWAILLPIVWVMVLPRRLLVAQTLLLLGILCWLTWRLLIKI